MAETVSDQDSIAGELDRLGLALADVLIVLDGAVSRPMLYEAIADGLLRPVPESEASRLATRGRPKLTWSLREAAIAVTGAAIFRFSGYRLGRSLEMARALDEHLSYFEHYYSGALFEAILAQEPLIAVFEYDPPNEAGEREFSCRYLPQGPRPAGLRIWEITTAAFLFRPDTYAGLGLMSLLVARKNNLAALAGGSP